MRRSLIILILSALIYSLTACSSQSPLVVAEYGKYNITLDEFEKAYTKNVGSYEKAREASQEELDKFMDLYLNFRMKLRDSEIRNYDRDEDLQKELTDYKKKVGSSFIIEKQIIEPALRDLYDKRKIELRVSHIMIRPDTITNEEAKELATELINRINNGESYDELAKEYSADQFSRNSGGDIYYIAAGQIIPEFEDAAYNTEVGKIYPEPVETRFGFHIIKVTDRRERYNKIRARHILIDFKDDEGKIDSNAAFQKISEIREKLISGEDFAELASEYSEDRGTATKGGDLGFFERRMMVKEFDETAFNLNVGEISGIVKSQFGYHIIKLEEIEMIPSYEEEKQNIRNIYKKTRYNSDYDKYINNLKSEFNFRRFEENIDKVVAANDSSIRINDLYWKSGFRNKIKDISVFAIKDYEISADSVFKHVRDEAAFRNLEINKTVLDDAIKKLSEDLLLQEKAVELDKTNSEFADLMEDYRNGIYIFKLQEEEVWNRIKVDTTKLYDFYLGNKEKFIWPDRVDFSEIHTKKDSLAKEYHDKLVKGADFDSLASMVTETFAMAAKKGAYGILNSDENELAQKAFSLEKAGDISEPFSYKTGWSIVRLNKKLPSAEKTFEEAKAEVASAYQEWQSKLLEEEYIKRLRSVYDPKIYYDRLNKAYKESEN